MGLRKSDRPKWLSERHYAECLRKEPYNRKAAEKAASEIQAKNDRLNPVLPYQCRYCHLWHVGKAPLNPGPMQLLRRTDETLLIELGSKVVMMLERENRGFPGKRVKNIKRRLKAARAKARQKAYKIARESYRRDSDPSQP